MGIDLIRTVDIYSSNNYEVIRVDKDNKNGPRAVLKKINSENNDGGEVVKIFENKKKAIHESKCSTFLKRRIRITSISNDRLFGLGNWSSTKKVVFKSNWKGTPTITWWMNWVGNYPTLIALRVVWFQIRKFAC